jgi:DNA-binding protein YbaB
MAELPSARTIQQQMDAALNDYEEQVRALREFQDNVANTNTVVHSKDRLLTMTFTGQGDLETLTINNNGYRTMAPNELATVITDTLAAGRAQAMEKLGGMFGGQPVPGLSFADLATGRTDPSSVLDAILGPALEMLPQDALSESERARLRPGT